MWGRANYNFFVTFKLIIRNIAGSVDGIYSSILRDPLFCCRLIWAQSLAPPKLKQEQLLALPSVLLSFLRYKIAGGKANRVHIVVEEKLGVYIFSAGAYSITLIDILDRVKGGVHLPPSLGWADFTILMECTPESGRCHSVYSVVKLNHTTGKKPGIPHIALEQAPSTLKQAE